MSSVALSAFWLSGEALAKTSGFSTTTNATPAPSLSLEAAPVLMARRHRDKRKKRSLKKTSEDTGSSAKVEEERPGGRRVGRDFGHIDQDGDDKASRAEWNRRGNFDRLDADEDGYLTLKEVRAMYKGHSNRSYDWPPQGMRQSEQEIDPSAAEDLVASHKVDGITVCGIERGRGCDTRAPVETGLFETGLGPVFPEGAACPGIDDLYALDYTFKRNKQAYHGGIDMPVRWGTPMLAVADGTVVAVFKGENSKRGIEVNLRHSPEDTGIQLWTYTQYGHMDKMPDLKVGQRVKMGDFLGPTGNSGLSGKGGKQTSLRRPAVHFAVFYSQSPKYTIISNTVVPVGGRWMDSNAIYRQKLPLDSAAMKALPDAEKGVAIPVMFKDGETFPADTKLVWPYSCKRG